MKFSAAKFVKLLQISPAAKPTSSPVIGVQRASRQLFSTGTFHGEANDSDGIGSVEIEDVDFLPERPEIKLHGVDPRKGWNSRGVHKAIICGKVGQTPVQKILRNGRTVTIFTVGTGGLFDQRVVVDQSLPKPAQWHRIAVHNDMLGAYAVQQLTKNSSVYVEGDIETRVYNDSINGEVKSIPEVCVRRDGRVRSYKSGRKCQQYFF